jgi:hypothetical protein
MKKLENGGILGGFETIRVFSIFIWKEQNCSSGEKKCGKIDGIEHLSGVKRADSRRLFRTEPGNFSSNATKKAGQQSGVATLS